MHCWSYPVARWFPSMKSVLAELPPKVTAAGDGASGPVTDSVRSADLPLAAVAAGYLTAA